MELQRKKDILYKIFPRKIDFFNVVNLNVHFHKNIIKKDVSVPCFEDWKREQLWDYCLKQIGNDPIDFLEFGVFKGYSINYWAKKNINPRSRFFGFDSFQGLPEKWGKENFDARGTTPKTDDGRISFIVGLFQQTLPNFIANFKPHSQLIIHIDSDLYSSSLYCLTKLDALMKPGTTILFDEFGLKDEFASFYDYVRSYYRKYSIVARTTNWRKTAIKLE